MVNVSDVAPRVLCDYFFLFCRQRNFSRPRYSWSRTQCWTVPVHSGRYTGHILSREITWTCPLVPGTRYEYCTTCQLSTYACIHISGMYTWYMIYSGVIYIYYTGIPGIYILLYTRYIYIILVYIYYPYLSYLVFYRAFRGVEPHRCTVFLLSKSHVAVGCCFYFFRIVRCGAMPFFIF